MSRVLVLLNPGNTSRHYMLGIARAAERLGILGGVLELGPIWTHVAGVCASERASAVADIGRQVEAIVRRLRVTHAVSYAHNGVFDFGSRAALADGRDAGVLTACGVRHVLLWTDHPNWVADGSALADAPAAVLGDNRLTHVLKSDSAAGELIEVGRWQRVTAMPMAEDYRLLRADPRTRASRDVVVILSDLSDPPAPVRRFLDESDPDPAVMFDAMAPSARAEFVRVMSSPQGPSDEAIGRLADDWLQDARQAPLDSFWRISKRLEASHAPTLAWARASLPRWYKGVQALQVARRWRRPFWLAWIARRADVALVGTVSPGGPGRVQYEAQASAYAEGRCALTVNAAHDEEGVTHKPFQIGAGAVACVHHASRGLEALGGADDGLLSFSRGRELLDAVRRLSSDMTLATRLGQAWRARCLASHTWDERLLRMLAAADAELPATRSPGCAA